MLGALAFTASASAETYCVNDPACVSGGGTNSPDVGSALGSAAGHSGDDDVVIGPGTYTDGPYSYPGGDGAVQVRGAGEGQTTLTMPVGNAADFGRTLLNINPNVTGSRVSDLTLALPASPASDQHFDLALFLFNSSAQHVTVTATTATDLADGILINGTAGLDDITADFPLASTPLFGDGAIRSGGDLTITDSHLATEGTAIAQFNGGHTTVRRTQIAVGDSPYAGQGVDASDGTVDVRDTLIDLGPGLGYGLNAEPVFPGDNGEITADHVTIVGGGSGSVGARAAAQHAIDNGSQSATLSLTNSVIRGAETGILRRAENPSTTNPGTNTANVTVDYTNTDTTDSLNGSNGAGTLTETNHVSGVPSFVPGSFRPARGSIMVDAGDPGFVPQPQETDLDGTARVLDGDKDGAAVTDLGAYELIQPTVKIKHVKVKGHHARVTYTQARATKVKCRRDHVKWELCPPDQVTYKHLKHGKHRVQVKVLNSVYRTSAVATKHFKVLAP